MDGRTLEKRYDQVLQEAQFLRARNNHLEQELRVSGPELYRAYQRINRLEQSNQKLSKENKKLTRKLAELTQRLNKKPKPKVPAFVKANVPENSKGSGVFGRHFWIKDSRPL